MPASELKHGTLALIEEGTPVVVIAPSGPGYNDIINNAQELTARGAKVNGYPWMRWVMEHVLNLALFVVLLFALLVLWYWFEEIRGLIMVLI